MILHASPVKFRGALGRPFSRFFVIRSNFCLYSYNSSDVSKGTFAKSTERDRACADFAALFAQRLLEEYIIPLKEFRPEC